jgi:hypothetical protein
MQNSHRNRRQQEQNRFLSRQLVGYPLNLGHVVVADRSGVTIIPGNGDTAPRRSDDCAKIGGAILPANAVGYSKKPGLIAGHCKYHALTAPHDCSDYAGPGNTPRRFICASRSRTVALGAETWNVREPPEPDVQPQEE